MLYLYLGIGWVVGAILNILIAIIGLRRKGESEERIIASLMGVCFASLILWPVALVARVLLMLGLWIAGDPVVKDEQSKEEK